MGYLSLQSPWLLVAKKSSISLSKPKYICGKLNCWLKHLQSVYQLLLDSRMNFPVLINCRTTVIMCDCTHMYGQIVSLH